MASPTTEIHSEETPNAQEQIESKQSHDDLDVDYKMTWRTYLAVLSLTLAWSVTTFGSSGPNSTVRFQVASFPNEAQNSSWIANAPLFSMIVLVPIFGTLSDRYGKKWFVCIGSLIGLIGCVICGSAKSLNMIIAGQAINGIAIGSVTLGIPAAMEVVPAKYRSVVFGSMLTLNGCVGAIMGIFVFAACVQNDVGGGGEGWKWGYYVEAILFGMVMIMNIFLYNPPPTELRRELTARQVLKSIDFIGLGILATGLVLLVVALVQGGTFYPWSSARIISMLVIGPILLIAFGVYEWRKKTNVVLNPGFFQNRNFSVFTAVTFLDGMVLYGCTTFIGEEIGIVYTGDALGIALRLLPFTAMICVGGLICGMIVRYVKMLKWPLVAASCTLTLFCGLMALCGPENESTFLGILAVVGFSSSFGSVIPVSGTALSVPSALIGTSLTVQQSARALGGTIGITIFSAIFGAKIATYLPIYVAPAAVKAGLPASSLPEVFKALASGSPQLLDAVPGMAPQILEVINEAFAEAGSKSFEFVWLAIMAFAAFCTLASLLVEEVPDKWTNFVESALEYNEIRKEQQHVA